MALLLGSEKVTVDFPAKTVLDEVTIGIMEGDRIGIVGRNGDGKSTLLSVLADAYEPDAGRIVRRSGVSVGLLGQVDALDPDQTVAHEVVGDRPEYEWASDASARDVIAGLLSDVPWTGTVGSLSGGQRRRVDLARLLVGSWDILMLDEPTNHLDVASREWIECALEDYEGTLIFVSHDRYFVDKFATRIWELSDGTIRDFPCGYAKYRAILEHEAAARQRPAQPKKEKQAKPVSGSKELEKLVRRLEREIAAKEDEAAQLEQALAGAASDYQELLRLTAEKERCEAELEDLMARWEEAAQALEQG